MGAYLMSMDGTVTLMFDVITSESWDGDADITDYNVEVGSDVTDNIRVATTVCTLKAFLTNEPLSGTLTPLSLTDLGPDQDPIASVSITTQDWDNGIALRAALMGVGDLIGGAAGGPVGTLVGGAVGALAGALLDSPGPRPVTIHPNVGLAPTPGTQASPQTYQIASPSDLVAAALNQVRTWKDNAILLKVIGTKETRQNMAIAKFNYTADPETGTGRDVTLTLREIRIVQTATVTAPAPTLPRAATPTAGGNQSTTPSPQSKSLAAYAVDQNQATLGGPPTTAAIP